MVNFFQDVLPLLFSVVVVIVILYLSYRFSKYLGSKANKISSSGYIQIMERVFLGQDKGLAVIHIMDKYYLIGFSNQEISVLMELPDYQITPVEKHQNFIDLLKSTIQTQAGAKAGEKKDES